MDGWMDGWMDEWHGRTWRRVWGGRKKFSGPNFKMTFFREKFPFSRLKFLMTFFVIDRIFCLSFACHARLYSLKSHII